MAALHRETDTNGPGGVIHWGPFEVDPERHAAEASGVRLDLTLTEFRLLLLLIAGRGRVVTREEILRGVWGAGTPGRARTLDVHIRRLRAKLGDVDACSIITIRKVGYRLAPGS